PPPAPPRALTLRVVTYNIRHGAGSDDTLNLERTAAVLRRLQPDIVALQEVDERVTRSGGVDQAARLGELLGMHPAFGSFMDYQGGRYGLALLTRFPIRRATPVRLRDGNEPRVALVVEQALPDSSALTAISVHFDWVANDSFRYAQAQQVAAVLDTLRTPYLLMGDFNDEPGSRTLALFQARATEVRKPADEHFTFSASRPEKEIDFIFVAPAARWRAASARVVPEAVASDHRPVFAALTLRPEPAEAAPPVAPAPPAAAEPLLLRGYLRHVAGELLDYRSPSVGQQRTLLVRSQEAARYIEWETDTVPRTIGTRPVTFLVHAGMDVNAADGHAFTLSVGGSPLFTFTSPRSSTDIRRVVPHASGAVLTFDGRGFDGHGDVFGNVWVSVPASLLRPGEPARLRVTGEQAGSPTWFMLFPERFQPSVQVVPLQAVTRVSGNDVRPLSVRVVHFGTARQAAFLLDGRKLADLAIEPGHNAFELQIPAAAGGDSLAYELRAGDDVLARGVAPRTPVRDWTVYLLPHSHNDIGYTELQTEVERKQWQNLRQALALAERTATYPRGAQFRWNVEVLWAVESFLDNAATPVERAAFSTAVRRGQIGLQAFYDNHLTGLASGEELLQLMSYARELTRRDSLPVRSAMITDIPGHSWGVVPAMAQSGVRWFSVGPNYMSWLPHRGDRVGYTLDDWGDRPFWWVSQSGGEKVLVWIADRGYSFFHGGNFGPLATNGGRPVLDYLGQLDSAGYPYDMVQLRYTVGGDNGPPDEALPDFVRDWNATHRSPRFVIATTDELFEAFEQRYGAYLPAVAGDFTPYWEDGAASTARETALTRNAADRLVQAATLWSLRDPASFPRARFRRAWRDVLLFDEHTWGAHNSISAPDDPFAVGQWEIKRRFALDADAGSRALLAEAAGGPVAASPAAAPVTALDVYNPTQWPRTELVRIPASVRTAGDRVRDDTGRLLPSQRLSTGELAVLLWQVPAFGARRVNFESGPPYLETGAGFSGNVLRNRSIEVRIDTVRGEIASLRQLGREFVDTTRSFGLNAYFYVPGIDPASAQTTSRPTIRVREAGPLVTTVEIASEAPGCNRLVRALTLVAGVDHLELTTLLDRKLVRAKEGVHLGFPFAIDRPQVHLDLAWAVARPEADQLTGAAKNHLSVQRWVDVANQDAGITLATPDAPLVELGGITAEIWKLQPDQPWLRQLDPSAAVFSYVMNNYWHTNYKADQPGETVLRYGIQPHGQFRAADAHRFAAAYTSPLVLAPADTAPLAPPRFRLEGDGVLVTALEPAPEGGGLVVRLFNASGMPQSVRLFDARGDALPIRESTVDGAAGAALPDPLVLPAYAVRTVGIGH
ncbi:MAG: hypothetical protein FIB01_07350, partial [Gemmatimonadetes bacterium]|nr:hypothetical protein [Gemmatimonadota bacterium]